VGLASDHIIVVPVKATHPGVVPQHRNHPVLLRLKPPGGFLYAGLKQIVNGPGLTRGKIPVMKPALKGVVVAVIASALGNVFEFHVRGIIKANGPPLGAHFRIQEILPDHRDVIDIEGKVSRIADLLQDRIRIHTHRGHRGLVVQTDLWDDDAHSVFGIPVMFGKNPDLLDNLVCQQLLCDALGIVLTDFRAPDAEAL